MYSIKKGVAIYFTEEIEKILSVVCPLFKAFYLPVVITSGIDGPHRENSLHGKFRAIDIRKFFHDPYSCETWTLHHKMIFDGLRDGFHVNNFPVTVLDETDHIHIEWSGP